MRINLLNEGTYPYTPGGTSVWSDLLVSNLPHHQFHLVTITANGRDRPSWPIHPNVSGVSQVPLWGRSTVVPRSRPRPLSTADRAIALLHRALVVGDDAQDDFRAALLELRSVPGGVAAAALCSDRTIQTVLETWGGVGLPARISLGDALAVCDVLQHTIRPLWFRLPPSEINHAVVNGLVMLPALAARWTDGTPIALSEHGVYLRERYLEKRDERSSGVVAGIMLRFYRMLATAGYQDADVIAPVTDFNRRWENRVGSTGTPIRTIYNGIDPAKYPEITSEPDFPTISWIGRIDPIKDLHTLIRAFRLVRDRRPEAKLRLFGPVASGCDDYAASCRQLVRDLDLTPDVSFDGRVDSSPKAFEAGHVVALSSVSEGMPYTVVEAMMCGKTTVSTDVGGVAEAVADCGIVVPPRDPESMSLWLLHFLENPGDRRLTGGKARERALRLFPLERSISSYDQLYADFGREQGVARAQVPAAAGAGTS